MNFILKISSEDNNSFCQILEKQKEHWKQKFWWMFKNDEFTPLALTISEKDKIKMVKNSLISIYRTFY